MMDASSAAAALVRARRDNRILESFPGGAFPATVAEAYAVLDAISRSMGEPTVGWKAAFTNDAGMKKMGVAEPAFGPLFASYVMPSPGAVTIPEGGVRGVECEFAFRMARDLAPRQTAYSDEEVADAVAALHPAIEVVGGRVKNGMAAGGCAVIADHCGNAAFVYGDAVSDWRGYDLAGHEVVLRVDGKETARGHGREVMGNPMTSLTWIVNKVTGAGRTIAAGQWATTGSTMGILPVAAGSTAVGDFGVLGKVEVAFSD